MTDRTGSRGDAPGDGPPEQPGPAGDQEPKKDEQDREGLSKRWRRKLKRKLAKIRRRDPNVYPLY